MQGDLALRFVREMDGHTTYTDFDRVLPRRDHPLGVMLGDKFQRRHVSVQDVLGGNRNAIGHRHDHRGRREREEGRRRRQAGQIHQRTFDPLVVGRRRVRRRRARRTRRRGSRQRVESTRHICLSETHSRP